MLLTGRLTQVRQPRRSSGFRGKGCYENDNAETQRKCQRRERHQWMALLPQDLQMCFAQSHDTAIGLFLRHVERRNRAGCRSAGSPCFQVPEEGDVLPSGLSSAAGAGAESSLSVSGSGVFADPSDVFSTFSSSSDGVSKL